MRIFDPIWTSFDKHTKMLLFFEEFRIFLFSTDFDAMFEDHHVDNCQNVFNSFRMILSNNGMKSKIRLEYLTFFPNLMSIFRHSKWNVRWFHSFAVRKPNIFCKWEHNMFLFLQNHWDTLSWADFATVRITCSTNSDFHSAFDSLWLNPFGKYITQSTRTTFLSAVSSSL